MYFRSKVEIRIAEELEKRGVTFFANARGRYSLDGSPVAAQYLNGRVEVDFLVFHQGQCVILQIDGPQHNGAPFRDSGAARGRGYAGDRRHCGGTQALASNFRTIGSKVESGSFG